MIKQVKVTLQSTIEQNNEKDSIKKDYVGEYNVINGVHYIRLNDDTGKMTLKINVDTKKLTCLWDNGRRVGFDEKQDTLMLYHLPQGTMSLTVKTDVLSYQMVDDIIEAIYLNYQLWHDGTLFGQYYQHYTVQ